MPAWPFSMGGALHHQRNFQLLLEPRGAGVVGTKGRTGDGG
jgi:hypothetical protein